MNVYLLTNMRSGAQALVFARVEHEARHRRPDGAVWRLGRWLDARTSRVASTLAWWPGSPRDVCVEPVLESIDGFGQVRVVNGRLQVTNNPLLCISSVICVVEGIVQPAMPPDSWSTVGNNGGC